MTSEQSFFLSVLADFLNKRITKAPDFDIDYDILKMYASIHQTEGIVYFQCANFLPEDSADGFLQAYSATMFINTNRNFVLNELLKELSAQSIPAFVIKGAAIAKLYPVPVLRTMGDTDLVVRTEDRQRVHQIMLSRKFVNETMYDDREWTYDYNGMEFELHDHLIYKESINVDKHEEFFNDFRKYVKDDTLDWNFHFLFLVSHLRKHLMNSGVGFRHFMDIALLSSGAVALDWDWIHQKLDALELSEFASRVFALNERWFGIATPVLDVKLDEAFFESATQQVFSSGIFGFSDTENEDNAAINNRLSGKSAVAITINKFFPTYPELITIPQYSFVKGKKYLVPIAWVYRICRGIFRIKLKNNIEYLTDSFVDKERIARRAEVLNQWGLR